MCVCVCVCVCLCVSEMLDPKRPVRWTENTVHIILEIVVLKTDKKIYKST